MTSFRAGQVLAILRDRLPGLQPAEQAVTAVLLDKVDTVIEMTSAQVADLAGTSRPTVIRTCQRLGFSGFQQLRALLTRDMIAAQVASPSVDTNPMLAIFETVAAAAPTMAALLDAELADRAVQALASASRLVVAGNGLSAPLAMSAALRLSGIGCLAHYLPDTIATGALVRNLTSGDVLLAFSGSGASDATLRAARDAAQVGATVLAVTSFSGSPLAQVADIPLVVAVGEMSFAKELTETSRIPHAILLEGLIAALAQRRGAAAWQARARTLEVVGDNLAE